MIDSVDSQTNSQLKQRLCDIDINLHPKLKELIFNTVQETEVIDTEPVFLTCDQSQAGSSYDDIAQLQETDERKEIESEKVILEDGLTKNGFFHSIGLDGGFGKPEYLTTDTETIFEERSMEEAADEENQDDESEEANDDFEVLLARFMPRSGFN